MSTKVRSVLQQELNYENVKEEIDQSSGQGYIRNDARHFHMAPVLNRLKYFSDWNRAKKAVAICLRLKHRIQQTSSEKPSISKITEAVWKSPTTFPTITVDKLHQSEMLKLLQSEAFEKKMKIL